MKTVITMVGTSLITNYLEQKKDQWVSNLFERYSHKKSSDYEPNKDDIDRLKKKLAQFPSENKSGSAEMKSLNKLAQEFSDDLNVYLLASDTINSRVCAEIIKETMDGRMTVHFSEQDIIKGLQVEDRELFAKKGMENLFKRIESITGGYYGNMIINITGGYKATIPLLTMFSQIYRIPTYYIFEDTEALMKIPLLPIDVDWGLFERYADIFDEVGKSGGGIDNWQALKTNIKHEHRDALRTCFEIAGNFADLSVAGKILWNRFQSRRFRFYRSEEVNASLRTDADYKNYLRKLFDEKLRESRTENKNGHLVFDLGTTAPRIFYRMEDGSFYIYKYTRHDKDYERFIDGKPFTCLDDYGPFAIEIMKK